MTVTATKTSLKKEAALLQTLSGLFCLVQFAKCWQFVLELKFKDCMEVQEKKKKVMSSSCVTSSTKREIRHFHVVVMQ